MTVVHLFWGAHLLQRVRIVRLQLSYAPEVRLRGVGVAKAFVCLGTPEQRLHHHVVCSAAVSAGGMRHRDAIVDAHTA